jgi:tripartite-type tricarboxylate transporter receptor subunit TctC
MRSRVPYDPVRDFVPITLAVSTPNILVVHPSVPVKSVRELIALARAKPGALNYATGNAGTSNHLAAELFKARAGVDMTRIPYKGGALAINDLIGGQVQLMFGAALAVLQHVQTGRLRGLAVTSLRPSPLAPGLPTVAETGVPGYESVATFGVLAPARTPSAIVARLNAAIVGVLHQPEVSERSSSPDRRSSRARRRRSARRSRRNDDPRQTHPGRRHPRRIGEADARIPIRP